MTAAGGHTAEPSTALEAAHSQVLACVAAHRKHKLSSSKHETHLKFLTDLGAVLSALDKHDDATTAARVILGAIVRLVHRLDKKLTALAAAGKAEAAGEQVTLLEMRESLLTLVVLLTAAMVPATQADVRRTLDAAAAIAVNAEVVRRQASSLAEAMDAMTAATPRPYLLDHRLAAVLGSVLDIQMEGAWRAQWETTMAALVRAAADCTADVGRNGLLQRSLKSMHEVEWEVAETSGKLMRTQAAVGDDAGPVLDALQRGEWARLRLCQCPVDKGAYGLVGGSVAVRMRPCGCVMSRRAAGMCAARKQCVVCKARLDTPAFMLSKKRARLLQALREVLVVPSSEVRLHKGTEVGGRGHVAGTWRGRAVAVKGVFVRYSKSADLARVLWMVARVHIASTCSGAVANLLAVAWLSDQVWLVHELSDKPLTEVLAAAGGPARGVRGTRTVAATTQAAAGAAQGLPAADVTLLVLELANACLGMQAASWTFASDIFPDGIRVQDGRVLLDVYSTAAFIPGTFANPQQLTFLPPDWRVAGGGVAAPDPGRCTEHVHAMKADVYAIGATAVFAATQQPPFGSWDSRVVSKILRSRTEPMQVPSTLPLPLRQLLEAMVALDPGRRPAMADVLQTSEAALRQLSGLEAPHVLKATWPGVTERTRPQSQKHAIKTSPVLQGGSRVAAAGADGEGGKLVSAQEAPERQLTSSISFEGLPQELQVDAASSPGEVGDDGDDDTSATFYFLKPPEWLAPSLPQEVCQPPACYASIIESLQTPTAACVTVSGNPGMGKSWVLEQLRKQTVGSTGDGGFLVQPSNSLTSGSQLSLANRYPNGVAACRFGTPPVASTSSRGYSEASELVSKWKIDKVLELTARVDGEFWRRHQLPAPGSTTLQQAAEYLRFVLAGKSCLLLVDDLHSSEQDVLEALLGVLDANKQCSLVVGARWKDAHSIPFAQRVRNFKLTSGDYGDVAESLLAAYAYKQRGVTTLKREHRESGERIISACESNPACLRILAELQREPGASSRQAWAQMAQQLLSYAVSEGDHPERAAFAAFRLARDHLDADTWNAARLLQFFEPGALVPCSALWELWTCHTHGTNYSLAQCLNRLRQVALLEWHTSQFDPRTGMIKFSAVLGAFLRQHCTLDPLPAEMTLPDGRLDATSASRDIGVRALVSIALYGAHRWRHLAASWLSAIRGPRRLSEVDWWRRAHLRDCPAEAVLGSGESIEEILGEDGADPALEESVRMLLLGAACGWVWPELVRTVPMLLREKRTALLAMRFVAGAEQHVTFGPRARECLDAVAELVDGLPGKTAEDARFLGNVAAHWQALRMPDVAVLPLRRQLRTLRMLAGRDDNVACAAVLQQIAGALLRLRRHEQAHDFAARAVDIYHRVRGKSFDSCVGAADALETLGGVELVNGKRETALECQQRALKIRKSLFGGSHPLTAASLMHLGEAEHAVGKLKSALASKQAALAFYKRQPLASVDAAECLESVARTMAVLGEKDARLMAEARQHRAEALQLMEAVLGSNHPDVRWMRTVAQYFLLGDAQAG